MGEEKVLYSVKMRSSLGGAHGVGGQHISGAERIVTKNSVEQEMISMLHRAWEHDRGAADSQIIAGQVADFLVTVQKIRCSFLFYYTENGLCLSARSDGSVNVQIVMEQLGGGGHQTVAGAQFGTDGNIEDITKAVVANVRKQTEEEKE